MGLACFLAPCTSRPQSSGDVDAQSFYTQRTQARLSREWLPGHLAVRSAFPDETLAELNRRGHHGSLRAMGTLQLGHHGNTRLAMFYERLVQVPGVCNPTRHR